MKRNISGARGIVRSRTILPSRKARFYRTDVKTGFLDCVTLSCGHHNFGPCDTLDEFIRYFAILSKSYIYSS